jgi:hypothetical protein
LSVARARALLAVSDGSSYTDAADLVGRALGDSVATWVARFNQVGLERWNGRPVGVHLPSMAQRSATGFSRSFDVRRIASGTGRRPGR